MSHFKAKITVLLVGILFLSGCYLRENRIINSASSPEKITEKLQNKAKKEASLLFVGDLMFDRTIRQIAKKKGNDYIFEKMTPFLKDLDAVVANLEGPITDNKSVSIGTVVGEKGHFSFTFDKSLATTLAQNNIKVVDIGNNHILNFGEKGLEQTKSSLKESGVDYFGDPIHQENNFIIKEISGVKIGFVSFNQFGGGSAEEIKRNIEIVRNKVDIAIVFSHWGKEYEKSPSDKIRSIVHSFIDAGADVVIGSHPHVIQDKEIYRGKMIYYSLGNFVFDQYFSAETMNGLAVKVSINPEDMSLKFEDFPLLLEKNGQTRLLN